MINVDWKSKLVDLSKFDLSKPLETVAKKLQLSIQQNFEFGGRPTWATLKRTGEASHLWKSGAMFSKISSGVEDGKTAWAGIPDNQENSLPYLFAHQWGYPLKRLPARRYIMFQKEDYDMVITELSEYIDIVFTQSTQSPDKVVK